MVASALAFRSSLVMDSAMRSARSGSRLPLLVVRRGRWQGRRLGTRSARVVLLLPRDVVGEQVDKPAEANPIAAAGRPPLLLRGARSRRRLALRYGMRPRARSTSAGEAGPATGQ